jgi:hypothetical protein
MLVEAGVPDQPWQTVNAAGTVCLRGRSIHGLAARYSAHPAAATRGPAASVAEPAE